VSDKVRQESLWSEEYNKIGEKNDALDGDKQQLVTYL